MRKPTENSRAPDDVAIIGIAGIYPGSNDFTSFSQQLAAQASWFRPIPENHFPSDAIRMRTGAFIDDVSVFDNEFFGILPVEAQYMDPRQRLLLMSCFHTLEDACYTSGQLDGSRVNVYVAAEGSPYSGVLDKAPMSPYVAPGISNWALPNRLSHHFGFKGKSILLDAGCCGSVAALHEAMEALRNDQADYALVGAVSLMFSDAAAGAYLGQESLGILADQATCMPFQPGAKGFLPAEACVTVLLKKRSRAEQDGDHIRALLIGAALNHSAGFGSFTAPSAKAQAAAMTEATRAAGIDPFSVTYIEAHGVSSPLADVEEVKAFLLADVMLRREFPDAQVRPCKISSIKPNVGHANCVSGLMSLTRILASFASGTRFGIKDFTELNDQIRLGGSRFHIDGFDEAWPPTDDGLPLRAAINNFSAGGSNAFLLVEHYQADPAPPVTDAAARFYLALSTPDPEQFTAYAAAVLAWLEASPTLEPARVEYLFAGRKQGFAHRRVFRYSGLSDLCDKLARFVASNGRNGFYFDGSPERDGGVRELFRRYKELNGCLVQQTGEEHKGLQFDMWARGVDEGLAAYLSGAAFPKHPLPLYPFRLRSFWALPRECGPGAKPAAVAAGASLAGRVAAQLAALFCDVSKIDPGQVEVRRPFSDYGIDSLLVVALNAALAAIYPGVSATLFFECANIEQVAARLAHAHPAESAAWVGDAGQLEQSSPPMSLEPVPIAAPATPVREPVAVIGLAGRYPMADDLEQFWSRIAEGADCITEIPATRWAMDGFYDPRALDSIEVGGQLRSYGKWGGFLDRIDEFDALLFKISPWEAALLDPQERLFLQTCWHLMEDAGYSRESLRREGRRRVAVFAGITKNGYELHAPALWAQGDNVLPRTSFSSVANRVSFVLDLTGPSVAVDTMCSSSLTAIHLACEHLLAGDSEMAIAGGVNLYLHPSNYLAMAGARMLSPSGRCSSFGADANGIVPGEGVGAVLLKRLSRAEADADRIQGLILASQANHGGTTNGYTVPNPAAQAELIAATIGKAGIAPHTITYVEAHGTGTSLGDPIELAGLCQAFGLGSTEPLPVQFCAIGSVKSNIGHLEAAAGVAGLTKILMQMRHGMLAPTLHAQPPNPAISFGDTPFRVQVAPAPWASAAGVPRRAALSSFGAGGANAHLIVEQYVERGARSSGSRRCGECIVLSAATEMQLRQQAAALLDWLGRQAPHDMLLEDMAFTLQAGRESMAERLAILASDPGQLRDKLEAFLAGVTPLDGCYRDTVRLGHEQRHIVFNEATVQRAQDCFARDGDYLPLLRLWLAGHPVDWRPVHAGHAPQRIGLPLYPFARERHALPALRPAGAPPASVAHQADQTSDARETVFLLPSWQALDRSGQAEPVRGLHHVVVLGDAPDESLRLAMPAHVRWHGMAAGGAAALAEWYGRACAQLTAIVRQCPPGSDSLVQLVVAASEELPASCALGLAGLLKCAVLEVPGLRYQSIQVDPAVGHEELVQLLQELAGYEGHTEFRAAPGRIMYRTLAPAPGASAGAVQRRFRPGAVYLVTGGLGGLGEVTARAIAAWAPDATLVLAGRSELDAARRQRVDALSALGVQVVYESVDVADQAQLTAMLARLEARGFDLKGIIHGAGELSDGLIANKTEEQSRKVLAAKVDGTVALDLATRAMALDFFVCYSSLAAEVGNAGQADYCAANGFMDHYMRHRASMAARGLRQGASQSINWPLWESGGMRAGAGVVEAMRSEAGMLPLSSGDGARALGDVLASGWSQAAVICRPADAAPVAAASPDTAPTGAGLENLVAGIVCASLGLKTSQLDGATPFSHVGMDSVSAAAIVGRLRAHFPDIPATLLFQYQTLDELCAYLAERNAGRARTDAPPARAETPVRDVPGRCTSGREPVAVVAYTGRFPGAADVAQFWDNLVAGRDAVSTVPAQRLQSWGAPLPALYDGMPLCQWGGFIEGAFDFDAGFFGIAPAEAMLMEPQERLMLESVWHLLERAGYTRAWRKQHYGDRIGVYVGASHSQYQLLGPDEPLAALASVNGNGSIANRTSYHFGFEGPSIAVDTMCSSAMTALALACRDLREGECEAAVVGAVNLSLHRSKYLGLSLAGLIARTGDSRSFGAGDGFIPSETVASVLLKTQGAAERDGDRIYGLLRAVQIGHDGSSAGYTTPSVKAQMRLFAAALDSADLQPAAVGMVEAAANGAPLLDAVEFAALSQVFGAPGGPARCFIGSVKSLLGHAEAASGLVQLIKVLLQMEHGRLLPLHLPANPNPDIDWSASPFSRPQDVIPWEGGKQPRIALINSIGAGGANACLLVEEYRGAAAPVADEAGEDAVGPQVFVVSARTPAQLREVLSALRRHLALRPEIALRDLAYTLQLRRELLPERFACTAREHGELLARIDHFLTHGADDLGLRTEVGEAGRLARSWARGVAVDWTVLHGSAQRNLVLLPDYPFSRQPLHLGAVPDTRPTARALTSDEQFVAAAVGRLSGQPEAMLCGGGTLEQLGISSISMLSLKHQLESHFGVPLEQRLFDRYQPLASFTAAVVAAAGSGAGAREGVHGRAALHPVVQANPADLTRPFALTDMQEAMWAGRRLKIGGDWVGCHIYCEFEAADLDPYRLNRAWQALVDYHPMLRAQVLPAGQQQIRAPGTFYKFRQFDLCGADADACAQVLDSLRADLSHRVYTLDDRQLFDIAVAALPGGASRIFFSIDESLVDAVSINILLGQWQALYRDPELGLPPQRVSFRDYVVAVRAFERGERFKALLAATLERFQHMAPGPQLPAAEQGGGDFERSQFSHRVAADRWQALQESVRGWRVSPTALLLGLFAQALRSRSAAPEFTLNLTYLNRPPLHPDIDAIVGPFISTQLLGCAAAPDLRTLLTQTEGQLEQALEAGAVSGVRILRELKRAKRIDPHLTLPVVFTSMLNIGELGKQQGMEAGELLVPVYKATQTPQVYLDCQVLEREGELHLVWDAATGAYQEGLVAGLFDHYCALVEHVASVGIEEDMVLPPVHAVSPPAPTVRLVLKPDPAARLVPFPLTIQQQAYGFARSQFLAGDSDSCQFYCEFDVRDADPGRLEQAWNRLMHRHPALVTRFQPGGTQQVMAQVPRYQIETGDLRSLAAQQRDASLEQARAGMMANNTPLSGWPFFRIRALRLDAHLTRVQFSIDMLIADGASIQLLLEQWFAWYHEPDLAMAPLELCFRDYVVALEAYKGSEPYLDDMRYWQGKFAGYRGSPLLPRHTVAGKPRRKRLSASFTDWGRLDAKATRHGVSPKAVLIAAYLEVLAAAAASQAFEIVVPGWRRQPVHPQIDEVVGDFTSMCWVANIADDLPFRERAARCDTQLRDDLLHGTVNGVSVLRRVRDGGGKMLSYQVVFSEPQAAATHAPGEGVAIAYMASKTGGVDLDNITDIVGTSALLHWDYAGGVLDDGLVERLFGHYQLILAGLAAGGDAWNALQHGPELDRVNG